MRPVHTDRPKIPWTRREASELAILFAAQSILFYAANAWLPAVYIERGWPDVDAGFLLAVVNGMGLLATFGLALLAQRLGSRREQMAAAAAAASFVGLLGIAACPTSRSPGPSCSAWGSARFPLVLTLPVDMADRAHDAGGLAAVMLFGGYIVSSLAPFLLGLVRDSTGNFALSLWLLVGVAVLLLALCWLFVPAGLGRRATPAAPGSFDRQRRC